MSGYETDSEYLAAAGTAVGEEAATALIKYGFFFWRSQVSDARYGGEAVQGAMAKPYDEVRTSMLTVLAQTATVLSEHSKALTAAAEHYRLREIFVEDRLHRAEELER